MVRYFDLLKELCSCFMTKDFEMRAQPKGVWGRREVNEQHREFIKKLMDLELKTSVNREFTKYYIITPEATMRDCMDWYNEECGNSVTFDSMRDAISYDKNKVLNVIPLERFNKLFYGHSDMSEEILLLDELLKKYGEKRDFDLGTPLDMSSSKEVKSLTEEEFGDLVSILNRYSYSTIEEVSRGINEKYKAYFNYMNNALQLDEENKERAKILGSILGIKVNVKKPDVKKELQKAEKKMPELII